MRSMTPQRVAAVRTRVVWTLRAMAAALLFVGSWWVLQRWAVAFMGGDYRFAYSGWLGVGDWHRMSNGVVFLALGGALAAFNAPIARWMTPPPSEGCPRCGFARGDDDPTRCTECGLPGVNDDNSRR